MTNSESRNTNNGLVGMRIIATLFIAIYHFELSYRFIENTQIFETAFLFVEFFFILSGFLFAKGMIDGRYQNSSLKTIICDRLKRLYPAYIIGLIILPAVYSLVWFGGSYFKWLADSTPPPLFFVHSRSFHGTDLRIWQTNIY